MLDPPFTPHFYHSYLISLLSYPNYLSSYRVKAGKGVNGINFTVLT